MTRVSEKHVCGVAISSLTKVSMRCPETPDLRSRILFQRQFGPISVVEMFFGGVSQFRLAAAPGYDRIISSAVVRVERDHVYWSSERDDFELQSGYQMDTGIRGRRLWWREVQNGLGPALRYGELEPSPPEPVP